MAYWLVKTEPDVYSVDDLKRDKVTYWDGVRNYQARNYMREMKTGESVFIYHSNAAPPQIVGLGKISKEAYPDPSQFDRRSPYFDPKASKDAPRWFCPDIRFVEKFRTALSLDDLRAMPELEGMVLLQRGSRLSVQPVTEEQFQAILRRAQA